MRIYVAGPMRGRENFNFPAFNAAAIRLRAIGHEVFSPAERDVAKHGDIFGGTNGDLDVIERKGFSLRDALGADMAWITKNADAIALLPGWEESKGATAEAALGFALGLQVKPVEEFYPALTPLD